MPPTPLSRSEVARLEALSEPTRWSLEDAVFVFDACQRTGLSVVKFAAMFDLCWRRIYWWRDRVIASRMPASLAGPVDARAEEGAGGTAPRHGAAPGRAAPPRGGAAPGRASPPTPSAPPLSARSVRAGTTTSARAAPWPDGAASSRPPLPAEATSSRAIAVPAPREEPAPAVEMSAPTAMKAVQEAVTASGGSGKHPKEADMYHAGMDLHSRTSTFHVTDGSGRQILAKTIPSTEEALGTLLREELGRHTRIYLEASTSSAWASRLIAGCGHEPIVVDPRRNRLIAASPKKTDKNDAATLASLGRAGLLTPVWVRSEETDAVRRVLTARAALVDARSNLSRTIRALHRSEAVLLPSGAPEDLAKRLLRDGTAPDLAAAALPLAQAMEALGKQVEDTEAEIERYAGLHADSVKILKSIPGVGDIVSVAFLAHLEDVRRFQRAAQVAAYFGLVPWVSESAGIRSGGGITSHGNKRLRKYLIQAAHAHLRSKGMTALKQWTLQLMERVGTKKATVALARKLAELMWTLLRKNRMYVPYPPGAEFLDEAEYERRLAAVRARKPGAKKATKKTVKVAGPPEPSPQPLEAPGLDASPARGAVRPVIRQLHRSPRPDA